MTYTFKWRRKLRIFPRWRTVTGHSFLKEQNKMVLYFANGGCEEIFEWDKCSVKLGPDWVAAVKSDMEKKAGQSIPVGG